MLTTKKVPKLCVWSDFGSKNGVQVGEFWCLEVLFFTTMRFCCLFVASSFETADSLQLWTLFDKLLDSQCVSFTRCLSASLLKETNSDW